jgi:hypothetical protein
VNRRCTVISNLQSMCSRLALGPDIFHSNAECRHGGGLRQFSSEPIELIALSALESFSLLAVSQFWLKDEAKVRAQCPTPYMHTHTARRQRAMCAESPSAHLAHIARNPAFSRVSIRAPVRFPCQFSFAFQPPDNFGSLVVIQPSGEAWVSFERLEGTVCCLRGE